MEIIKNDDHVLVKPMQDIVASMADDFKTELQQITESEKKGLVIDMEGVDNVDPIGIGVVFAAYNSLEKLEQKLRLVNINKDIYSLFTTMRLDRYFEIKSV